MDPKQCDFLFENELIEIVPNFTSDRLELICGSTNAFEPGIPMKVPVWLALHLRKRQKCVINPPSWMNLAELQQMATSEAKSDGFSEIPERFFEMSHVLLTHEAKSDGFSEIPERFFEMSHVLLTQCKEDIENLEQMRTLVKDIWDMRTSKMKTSTINFLGDEPRSDVQIDNITQFEIAHVRGFLSSSLSTIADLSNFVTHFEK
uniref:DNA replication complex GINS protein PSF2 n=1 Tax=Panagrolaimus sp. JU765 TaxID=591449 RepID=A0AC34REX9_9BILA